MQFRSGNHLHCWGCSSQLLTLFIRLRNPSIERKGCSIYATSSLLINAGKGILCKRNGNGFLCSCRQEYPLESAQAVIWHGTVCIALDIEPEPPLPCRNCPDFPPLQPQRHFHSANPCRQLFHRSAHSRTDTEYFPAYSDRFDAAWNSL